jgi:hypothetical protein
VAKDATKNSTDHINRNLDFFLFFSTNKQKIISSTDMNPEMRE